MGFGHLRRTLALAALLRPWVRPLFLLDAEDRWSKSQVKSCGFNFRCFDPCQPMPEIDAAAVLIDTRRRAGLQRLVAEARLRRVPVASIHDLGLAPLAGDVAIDGSILPAIQSVPNAVTACFRGTRFCILDPGYEHCHQRRKPIRSHIRRVVINLGGGDGSRFLPPVLEGLRATDIPLEVFGLRGFCRPKWAEMAPKRWHPLRFRWFPRNGDVARLLLEADLAITAGGRSAYEALCVGIPLCALSWDRHQAATLSALARAGCCVNLGRGDALRSADVLRRVSALDGDHERRRVLSRRGRKMVDGGGARRVAAILRRLIRRGCPAVLRRAPSNGHVSRLREVG
jgi:UDP-2,4-diacetamido-2,4,6-trideoxy-beta-L-altropyranose hydrolase